MKWRPVLKRFGIRCAICLAVLGLAYGLVFGFKAKSHNKPNTPAAQIVRLRSALDQILIDTSTLASFKQNDAVSYSVMGGLSSKLQSDTSTLQTALGQVPSQVPFGVRGKITNIITQQQRAGKQFTATYGILSHAIAYDPASNLGGLDPTKDSAKLQQRAAAAQSGLKKAASDNTSANSTNILDVGQAGDNTTLINNAAKQALQTESDCFGQLATTQAGQVDAVRANCIKNYPATRQAAISNVISSSYPASYVPSLKNAILPLLNQLDKLSR